MSVQKRKRIKKLRPTFVSLLRRGANLTPGLLKAEEGEGMQLNCLTKTDTEGLLHVLVYSPDLDDAHSHSMEKEDIREACHYHSKSGLTLDIQHNCEALKPSQAHVVENMILTKQDPRFTEVDRKGRAIKHEGAWAQIIKIEDPDLLQLAKDGELTEVSLFAPEGNFELVDDPAALPKSDNDQEMDPKELAKALKEAFADPFAELAKTITESVKESLAKALPKSDDGDGNDTPPDNKTELKKGIVTFDNEGQPEFDYEQGNDPIYLKKYQRALEDASINDLMKAQAGNAEAIQGIVAKRLELAKTRREEDAAMGLGKEAGSVLKGMGFDKWMDGTLVKSPVAADLQGTPEEMAKSEQAVADQVNAEQLDGSAHKKALGVN